MDFFSSLFKPDIGKLKAKRDVEGLIKALSYRKDAHIRAGAAKALGEIKDARAVEALIAASSDEDSDVRKSARDSLANFKSAPAAFSEEEKMKKMQIEKVKQEIIDMIDDFLPDRKEESVLGVSGKESFTNTIGMRFALIPAGEFMMGSNEYDSEKPVHKVRIGKPFYLGVYPVTQKEWKVVMGANPSYFKGDDLPVESVSWDDVQEFVKKLNEKERTDKYRLPTEAEWEYAARAGTTTRYSFGDYESKLGDYAWYGSNSGGKTHDVGQKKPNPWGLYDMHGNVWEWVQDSWHGSYDGAPTDGSSWESGGGSSRVFRGGGWNNSARGCRSAYRISGAPGARGGNLGFRLLRIL